MAISNPDTMPFVKTKFLCVREKYGNIPGYDFLKIRKITIGVREYIMLGT